MRIFKYFILFLTILFIFAACSVLGFLIPQTVTSVTIIGDTNAEIQVATPLIADVSVTGLTYKAVTWSSSDTNIATVDTNGIVTGVAIGNVTITAKSVFDINMMGSHDMTVVFPTIKNINSVTLDGSTNVQLSSAIRLTATIVATGGADNSFTWSFNDPSILIWSSSDTNIATVDTNGVVTGVAIGNVAITAKSVFDSNQMHTRDVEVTAISIASLSYDGSAFAYPTKVTIDSLAAVLTPASAADDVTFSGNLPAGLTLDPATGEISGAPTDNILAAKNYIITAMADPNSTIYAGSAQVTLNMAVLFQVYGYRLTISTPNNDSNPTDIILQAAEGDICDGSNSTDLLTGVIPTGSSAETNLSKTSGFLTSLTNFNDGSETQHLHRIYHSIHGSTPKMIQVLGSNQLTVSSGVFRIRVLGRETGSFYSYEERMNGIVVTLLNQQGIPIGTASQPATGFSKSLNEYGLQDGFEVEFNATDGTVLVEPTIFSKPAVHGYALAVLEPNEGSNIVLQVSEGNIYNSGVSYAVDLLANVPAQGSPPGIVLDRSLVEGQESQLFYFNDGEHKGAGYAYYSKINTNQKAIGVLGANPLHPGHTGIFRVRIIADDDKQLNGVVVAVLDADGNPIGEASKPLIGWQDSTNKLGFVVDFRVSDGVVITQPTIIGNLLDNPDFPNLNDSD